MAKKKKRGPAERSRLEPQPDAPTPEASSEPGPTATAPEPSASVAASAAEVHRSAPRPGSNRTLENAFIAAFLLFMIAMPMRYYLGGRGLDERFSWRMFSTIRMLKCEVEVEDVLANPAGGFTTRPVSLTKEVQVAWVGMLERARELVVRKLLERRCDAGSDAGNIAEVRYHLECTSPDGSRLPAVDRHMDCKTRAVAEGKGRP